MCMFVYRYRKLISHQDGHEQSPRQRETAARGEQGAVCPEPALQDHIRGNVSTYSNTINIYISWPGTTYSASTGPYGRSEWATHPRPGARHLWCTRISSTPRTPATICLALMCVTGQRQHLELDQYYIKSIARYLVVLYYQANKAFEKMDAQKKEADLQKMKEKYNLNTPGRV